MLLSRKAQFKLRQKLAREIVEDMLKMALKEGLAGNIKRAEELGRKARRIAKNFGIKIPKQYKFYFCRRCKEFLIPGVTMRVRIRKNREPHITIYCEKCKSYRRIYFKRSKTRLNNI